MALDRDALALAAELESLGGGDARVGCGAAIVCVRPATASRSAIMTHGARPMPLKRLLSGASK